MTKVLDEPTAAGEPLDFSLVLGGPLYQLFRRAHLTGDAMELLHRRVLAFVLMTWVPLLVLSALGGHAVGHSIRVPFLLDFETHARFLVALPALILAELLVHVRHRHLVQRFVDRRIVSVEDMPKFQAAIQWGLRLRNSVPLEIALLVLVWTVGHAVWRSQTALSTETWYAMVAGGRWQLTIAGYWFAFVSIPIFQFILIRWYMRFLIWFGFLWRVSRLNLHLIPTHPDRAGGLAFLGTSVYAFSPVLFAQGSLLAGMMANRVLYEGAKLLSFRLEAVTLIGVAVLFVLGPLMMFTPKLMQAKRQGLGAYGLLAGRYVDGFEQKWILGKRADGDELLGSADIQSLADLANSFAVVREMRFVPFGVQDITRLALTTAAPLVPVGLTVLSLEDLVFRLIKILF
jgi:hypothetical protein